MHSGKCVMTIISRHCRRRGRRHQRRRRFMCARAHASGTVGPAQQTYTHTYNHYYYTLATVNGSARCDETRVAAT